MDTQEIERALRRRVGPHIHYKGVFTSDHLPCILYNSKPITFIANTLPSYSDISTVGHWVCFYISFYPVKKISFL